MCVVCHTVTSPTTHSVEIIFPTSFAKQLVVKLELHLVPFLGKLRPSLSRSLALSHATHDGGDGCGVVTDGGDGCGVVTDGGNGCGVVTDGGDGCDVVTNGGDGCDVVTDGGDGFGVVTDRWWRLL